MNLRFVFFRPLLLLALFSFLAVPFQEAAAAIEDYFKIGNKLVIHVNVKFADEADYPVTDSAITETMNQVATNYAIWSYGRMSITYQTYNVSLDVTKAESTFDSLRSAALNKLGLTRYDADVFIFRNSTYPEQKQGFGTDFFVYAKNTNPLLYSHELGHTRMINILHANWWIPNADQPPYGDGTLRTYGDVGSIMGSGSDYNASEKRLLGWLDDGTDFTQVAEAGTYIHRIYPVDTHTDYSNFDTNGVDGAYFATRVVKQAYAEHGGDTYREQAPDWDYWLTFRNEPDKSDTEYNPWLQNGIRLHWCPLFDLYSSEYYMSGSVLVDAYPKSNDSSELGKKNGGTNAQEQDDAPILIGDTYIDTGEGNFNSIPNHAGTIYITPLRKYDPDDTPRSGDEYMDVKVVIGDQTNNLPPTASWTVSATEVAPGQSVTFDVTASDSNDTHLGYLWDFGLGKDGLSRIAMPLDGLPSQTFSYDTPGYYMVSVTVNDGRGASTNLSQGISVTGDTDGDGLQDSWEWKYFGSIGFSDGSGDADGDDSQDFYEYLYGSDPADASSRGFGLAVGMHDDGTSVASDWSVRDDFILGLHYRVVVSSNLITWDALPGQYNLNRSTNGGMKTVELILPDEYGPKAFFKFVKP